MSDDDVMLGKVMLALHKLPQTNPVDRALEVQFTKDAMKAVQELSEGFEVSGGVYGPIAPVLRTIGTDFMPTIDTSAVVLPNDGWHPALGGWFRSYELERKFLQ
jgi:hypothetical protein